MTQNRLLLFFGHSGASTCTNALRLKAARLAALLLVVWWLCSCAVPPGYKASGFVPEGELKVTRLVNMGVSDFARNRFELAEESFLQAQALKPNSPTIAHNLALTYFRLGAFPEAEDAWRLLIARRPDDPNLYFEFGNYLAGRKKNSEALANFEVSLNKKQILDKADTEKSSIELSKESLFVKIAPVTLPPIISALTEVSWRAGFRKEAICYAARGLLQEGAPAGASLNPVITSVRVLTSLGATDLALEAVRLKIPQAMQSRSASIAHVLGLLYFVKNDQEKFIENEIAALESFDLDEAIKAEIDLLRRLIAEPYDVTLSGKDRESMIFWPPELRELAIGSNWDQAEAAELRTLSQKFEKKIIDAGLADEEPWWSNFTWLYNLYRSHFKMS